MRECCDVLIVGGGGAALRAAIAAHEASPGLDILLVTKGVLGQSGVTATACSDRMAFHATLPTTEPGGADAWRLHADDIFRIGGYVSDADLADQLAQHSAMAFDYLDTLGVPWARKVDGTVDQFVTDGSQYARACYTGPYTANHIEEALLRQLQQTTVRIMEHQMVAELLLDETRQRVIGAASVSQQDDTITALSAKAVVLATGGAGQVFAANVFPADCTGDGYALAYRAGAELVNLEFIQLGLCSVETGLACSGSMMRALPRLVNDLGEEFLPRYAAGAPLHEIHSALFHKGASWPVSYQEPTGSIPPYRVDIAVAQERRRGRRIFLDYTRNPMGLDWPTLQQRLSVRQESAQSRAIDPHQSDTPLRRLEAINRPSIEWLAQRGVLLERGDLIEIAPAAQHFQGGVKIRTLGETSLRGLYAAGEVAGGQHGANRPGGNALLDAQVFGRIAGENAARFAKAQSTDAPISEERARDTVCRLLTPGSIEPASVRKRVAEGMSSACGVYRTERALAGQLAVLIELAASGVGYETGSAARSLEALNLLQVARLTVEAALARDESRGPHLRFVEGSLEPLPQDEARWRKYLVIRRGPDSPLLEQRVPLLPQRG